KNNTNPIVGAYINNQNPRTIYVRAQFDNNNNGVGDVDECVATDMSFNLIINANPSVFEPTPIQICSYQINTEYNLTIRKNEITRSEEHTSELQSRENLVCRLLLEKKK